MAQIGYIAPNGTSCCLPVTSSQTTHPSLAFVDPNGTTQYLALTTAAVPGTPHIQYNGIEYSVGAAEEECGGVRIHSDYMCVNCCYNYNTIACFCFCVCDEDYDFSLGLNPTYSTGSNGWATVTWNSKNYNGTSPTISEHFACMAAHSTNANAITWWTTTIPDRWNRVNSCIAAGCVNDPDTGGILCAGVAVVVRDNCYWSQEKEYCWQIWNNYSGWSSCAWSHQNCCPFTCWSPINYIGYDLNRTSGTVSVGTRTVSGAGCRCVSNVVTEYCYWTQCSEESYGCWYCCGYLTCYNLGPLCMCVYGNIPNGSVRVCNYGCCWNNGSGGVCVVIPATANTWTGGTGNYNWANPSFRMDVNQGHSHSCWIYCACTSEYSCTSICCSCFQGNPWCCCARDWYTPNVALIATGKWSDGTSSWTPSNRYACFRANILNSNNQGGQTCCCYCYDVYSCWGGSKSWQDFTNPSMVHCAW